MPITVAELVATLTIDDSQFQSGINRVNTLLGTTGKEAEAANRAVMTLEQSGRSLMTLGGIMSAGLTAPFVAFTGAAVRAESQLDRINKGLETLTGSAAAARIELDQIAAISRAPGLSYQQAVRADLDLQNAGMSARRAHQAITEFGNALALSGRGADDLREVERILIRIQTTGQINMRVIGSLAARVPEIGAAMQAAFDTSNVKKIGASGISGQDFIDRLLDAMQNKIPRATTSLQDHIQHFQDSVQRAFAKMGENLAPSLGRFLDWLGPKLEQAADWFDKLSPTTKNWAFAIAAVGAAAGPVVFTLGLFGTAIINIQRGLGALFSMQGQVLAWWEAKKAAVDRATFAVELNNAALTKNIGLNAGGGGAGGRAAAAAAMGMSGLNGIPSTSGLSGVAANPTFGQFQGPTMPTDIAAARLAQAEAQAMGYGGPAGVASLSVGGMTALARMRSPGLLARLGGMKDRMLEPFLGPPAGMMGPPLPPGYVPNAPTTSLWNRPMNFGGVGRFAGSPMGMGLIGTAISMGTEFLPEQARESPWGGIGRVFGSTLQGAGLGAGIGGLFGAGAGALPGGIIGAVGGFGMGVWNELNRQGDRSQLARNEFNQSTVAMNEHMRFQQAKAQRDAQAQTGLPVGDAERRQWEAASRERFTAGLDIAKAELQSIPERERAKAEEARLIPMIRQRQQELLAQARALEPQIQTDARMAQEYWQLRQQGAALELQAGELSARAAKRHQEAVKRQVELQKQNRELRLQAAEQEAAAGIDAAPQGQQARATFRGMTPILQERMMDTAREAQRAATTIKDPLEREHRLLELNKEYWASAHAIQRLRVAASHEEQTEQKQHETQYHQVVQSYRQFALELAQMGARHAPEGTEASVMLAKVIPLLEDEQRDILEQLKVTQRNTVEYWTLAREAATIQSRMVDYEDAAIKERNATIKKAAETAKAQRREQMETNDLRVRLIEAQAHNMPWLTQQQQSRAVQGSLFEQFKEIMRPVQGETERERIQRQIEGERVRHDILEGAGIGRENFGRTFGGGRVFMGDARGARRMIQELDVAEKAAQGRPIIFQVVTQPDATAAQRRSDFERFYEQMETLHNQPIGNLP
jgi:hypothetical protein